MKTLLQVLNKDDDSLKSLYLSSISKFGIAALLLFSMLNAVYNKNYLLSIIEFTYVFIFLFIIVKMESIKHIANYLVTYTFASIIAIAIYMAPTSNFTIIWSLVIPINSFFLLGLKGGRNLSILFFIYILFLLIFIKTDDLNLYLNPNITVSYAVIGLMAYVYELYHQQYNEQNINLIKQLAEEQDTLEQIAITDEMTGLYNREKMNKILEGEFSRYNRYDTQTTIMIIDIDEFKEINVSYGQQVGDTIIEEFVTLLKNNFRDIDCLGRWGGNEFLVVLPNTSVDDACSLAERFCLMVEKYNFGVVFSNTCSIGLSNFIDGDSINSVLARTTKLLHIVKSGGGNGYLHY